MPLVQCTYCGTSFPGRSTAKFCSRQCYLKNGADNAAARQQAAWKAIPKLYSCEFNEGVSCFPVGDCQKCGWNPNVAQKRLERILAKLLGAEGVLADGA